MLRDATLSPARRATTAGPLPTASPATASVPPAATRTRPAGPARRTSRVPPLARRATSSAVVELIFRSGAAKIRHVRILNHGVELGPGWHAGPRRTRGDGASSQPAARGRARNCAMSKAGRRGDKRRGSAGIGAANSAFAAHGGDASGASWARGGGGFAWAAWRPGAKGEERHDSDASDSSCSERSSAPDRAVHLPWIVARPLCAWPTG